MKRLKHPLLLSVAWVVLIIAITYVHTEFFMRDASPEQDDLISELYGEIAGFGFTLVWAIWFLGLYLKKKQKSEIS